VGHKRQPSEFGVALKGAREAAGLTQKALAEAAEVQQASIAQVETGARQGLGLETIHRLESALGVPAGQLARHIKAGRAASVWASTLMPLVGVVSAGPGEDEEFPPGTTLPVSGLWPKGAVAYQVRGVSMVDELIGDGDYIIVRPKPVAEPGEKVVVWHPDCGTLVKIKRKKHYASANERQPRDPLAIHPECKEYGVLVGVIRKC
jgi:SOS-response transcriptional repressor LexA